MDSAGHDAQNDDESSNISKKLPFKIISFALDKLLNDALPFHLRALKKQSDDISTFQEQKEWKCLQSEQVQACNTVKSLKADLYELQSLSQQVEDEDIGLFQRKVEVPTQEVIKALAEFLELNYSVMRPLPQFSHNALNSNESEIPPLVCNLDEPGSDANDIYHDCPSPAEQETLKKLSKVDRHWQKLKSQFSELNELFRKFGSLVYSHREDVDKIEDNIHRARENVEEGEKQLRKSLVLHGATSVIPVTGALLGGLVLGPVGAVAGFKLFGSVAFAVSGSLLGFGAGWKIKKRRLASTNIEMKALTSSSKSQSFSSPDLRIPECVPSTIDDNEPSLRESD